MITIRLFIFSFCKKAKSYTHQNKSIAISDAEHI